MPIRMTVSMPGLVAAQAHLKKVLKYVEQSGEEVSLAGFNAAGSIFEKNFDAEGKGFGVGGWDQLAESTVRQREAKGFSGEHPILIMYNDLRTITATSLRIAGGSATYTATDPDGKTVSMSLNVGRNGGYAQVTGDKAWNQVPTKNAPARPFWFTTTTVTRAVRKAAVETLAVGISRL